MRDVRDRIVAAGMEGMTAAETQDTESQALAGSVVLDGFAHVDGTGGFKPTGRGKQRRQEPLIEAQDHEQEALHFRVRSDFLFSQLMSSPSSFSTI